MKTRKDFASDEEWQVWNWLKEAEQYRFIKIIQYQPGPFELAPRVSVKVTKQLKTKTKEVDKFLFHTNTLRTSRFGSFLMPLQMSLNTHEMGRL